MLCLSTRAIERERGTPMETHDESELVKRLERVIGQAKDAGRKEDWPSVFLLLKEALDTVKQLSEKQAPKT
jgi:hypothetical protein